MKVLDLHCPQPHSFEGWFASEDDFQQQLRSGLLSCPLCGSTDISKKISAPRLNLSHPPSQDEAPTRSKAQSTLDSKGQAAWLKALRAVVAHTEDVGDQFAQVARQMHYGEVSERGIRGQATLAESAALQEEGIAVFPLDLPLALKHTLQ
ncbi:MAG: DUF1178 family protein [Burkholderiaceae bacterium]